MANHQHRLWWIPAWLVGVVIGQGTWYLWFGHVAYGGIGIMAVVTFGRIAWCYRPEISGLLRGAKPTLPPRLVKEHQAHGCTECAPLPIDERYKVGQWR